jgi:hypothetical protein
MRCAMSPDLASPWREFLDELDVLLQEPCELHCIGGFAVVAAYGLPRSTNDLDYYALFPRRCTDEWERTAGEGSDLARKDKVHVHHAAEDPANSIELQQQAHERFAGRLRFFGSR